MKNLLIILVILLAATYYLRPEWFSVFNFQSAPPTVVTTPGANSHSFDAVSTQLQGDMDSIPTALDGAAPRPAHAYDVKHKLARYVNLHPEYQTLTQVCDLIIEAEAQRDTLQQSAHAAQARTTFHSALDYVDKKHPTPPPTPAQDLSAAAHQHAEGEWSSYRAKTSGEVARLLDTLKGKTL